MQPAHAALVRSPTIVLVMLAWATWTAAFAFVDWGLAAGFFGLPVALAGFFYRVGDESRCAKCAYEFTHPHPPRCPECGAKWVRWEGIVRGHRETSWPLVLLGIAFLVIAASSPLDPATVRQFARRNAPPGILMSRVEKGADWRAAEELIRRKGPPAQDARLANAVIAWIERSSAPPTSRITEWLSIQCRTSALPQPLIARYYRAVGPRPALRAPARLAVGDVTPISLPPFDGAEVAVLVGSAVISDALDEEELLIRQWADPAGGWIFEYEGEEPGRVGIRVVGWLIAGDSDTIGTVGWSSTGEPVFRTSFPYIEKVDFRTEIEVLPHSEPLQLRAAPLDGFESIGRTHLDQPPDR